MDSMVGFVPNLESSHMSVEQLLNTPIANNNNNSLLPSSYNTNALKRSIKNEKKTKRAQKKKNTHNS